MKLLYFHQHFSTPDGSTGTRSYEFAKELIGRGHEVIMVCGSSKCCNTGLSCDVSNGIRRGSVDGIKVIEIYLPYSNYLSFFKRSAIFLKFALRSILIALKEDYDLLFATSTPLTVSIPGIVMRVLKPRKKFVFEVRDLWPELPKSMGVIKNPFILAGLSVLEKLSYFSMHKGIALSPGIKKGMEKGGGRQDIELIPNGCDLDLFVPGNDKDKSGKELLRIYSNVIQSDDFVAVFTGSHGLANGLDAVLSAAKLIKESKIKIVFIGDGKLKPHLVKRAELENITNCVFLDSVSKTVLAGLLKEADIGLMILDNIPAFYYGTSPNKFFDYIALGLPVVTNYPGWICDMITAENCGIGIDPENNVMFANTIVSLYNDREKVDLMGRNSRKLAEKQFNRSDLADKFVKLIESTI